MPHRNPDLDVDARRLSGWNGPERRRESFRNLHLIHRRGLSFRSASVLTLTPAEDAAFSPPDSLLELLSKPAFCSLVVVQEPRILFERYAPDFGPAQMHSMQSITKTFVHLAMGRLIETDIVDPARLIGDYVPEAGSAYAGATVQQALDMDVSSSFAEDYAAPYDPAPRPGEPTGYARQEIAMGWRLPPTGEAEMGVRAFAAGLVAAPRTGGNRATLYTSPNTDMLGWVIERASGRALAKHVDAIIEAAGIEGSFHISADCEGVPVLSGGGVMTARDLARYGLLLARGGAELGGSKSGRASFLQDAMSGAGTAYGSSPELRYRNHLLTNGRWIGHPGYAGQFLMIDTERRIAAAFYSVLETPYGEQDGYFAEVIAALDEALSCLV